MRLVSVPSSRNVMGIGTNSLAADRLWMLAGMAGFVTKKSDTCAYLSE